jgi:hypothetical protein
MRDIFSLARAVLLAFADLGVYLPSNRKRVIDKVRSADRLDTQQLEGFIELCIEAQLIAPGDAGCLRLSPAEAKVLEISLDGSTPVPERQAIHWTERLGADAAALLACLPAPVTPTPAAVIHSLY